MPRRNKETIGLNLSNEDGREKFLRIGRQRMNRALHSIRLIGNLSSAPYVWSGKDVEHIRHTLELAIRETVLKFNTKKAPEAGTFDFPVSATEIKAKGTTVASARHNRKSGRPVGSLAN
jgi:hypothetical protein